MPWIQEVDVPLSPVINSMSINKSAMDAVQNLANAVIRGGSCLTRVQEEAISTVVAATNHCRYLTLSHGGFLRQHSDDSKFASHVIHDYTKADLDPKTRGMLDFAVKLTRDPSGNQKADVEKLRELGLDEQEILATVLVTCFFNFMTRLADGLGVEIQENRFEDLKRWLSDAVQSMSWLMVHKEK